MTYQDRSFRALLDNGHVVNATRILNDDGNLSIVTTLGLTIPAARIVQITKETTNA